MSISDDQKSIYEQQQQAGRKELWREALESSAQGDFFLISLLEVVLEDEQEQAEQSRKQAELNNLLKVGRTLCLIRLIIPGERECGHFA